MIEGRYVSEKRKKKRMGKEGMDDCTKEVQKK